MMVIGIDPGKSADSGIGWGMLHGGPMRQFLVRAGVCSPEPGHRYTLPVLAQLAVRDIRGPALDSEWAELCRHGIYVVVERMVHYPRHRRDRAAAQSEAARTKIANDLLDLQAIGALIAAALAPLHCIDYVTPHEWKRNLSWEMLERRLYGDAETDVPAVLDHGEAPILRAVKGAKRHNAVEAVAMAAQAAGRVSWV